MFVLVQTCKMLKIRPKLLESGKKYGRGWGFCFVQGWWEYKGRQKKQASWNQRPWSSIKEVRGEGKFEKRKRAQSLLSGPASPREVVGNLVNYQSLNKAHWQWRGGKDWQTPNKKEEAIQTETERPEMIYLICMLVWYERDKRRKKDERKMKKSKDGKRWEKGGTSQTAAAKPRVPFPFYQPTPPFACFSFLFLLYQLT